MCLFIFVWIVHDTTNVERIRFGEDNFYWITDWLLHAIKITAVWSWYGIFVGYNDVVYDYNHIISGVLLLIWKWFLFWLAESESKKLANEEISLAVSLDSSNKYILQLKHFIVHLIDSCVLLCFNKWETRFQLQNRWTIKHLELNKAERSNDSSIVVIFW